MYLSRFLFCHAVSAGTIVLYAESVRDSTADAASGAGTGYAFASNAMSALAGEDAGTTRITVTTSAAGGREFTDEAEANPAESALQYADRALTKLENLHKNTGYYEASGISAFLTNRKQTLTHITVRFGADMAKTSAAEYDWNVHEMILKNEPLTQLGAMTIMHESVHAADDLAVRNDLWTSELRAYTAEFMLDQGFALSGVDRMIARGSPPADVKAMWLSFWTHLQTEMTNYKPKHKSRVQKEGLTPANIALVGQDLGLTFSYSRLKPIYERKAGYALPNPPNLPSQFQ